MSSPVETIDVELVEAKEANPIADTAVPSEKEPAASEKNERPAEPRRLEPDADCTGDECPVLAE